MKAAWKRGVVVLLPLSAFAVTSWRLAFIQDDAYIYYRYVANALSGHGFVYNVGERIEGFTSLAWLAYLLAWHNVGVDYILASRITGFVFGAALIVLTYWIGRRLSGRDNAQSAFLAVCLVGTNLALAYWSSAGLETALFAFLFDLSLLLFLQRQYLIIAVLAALVWTRPEAPFVIALLTLIELVIDRRLPRFMLRCAAVVFVLSIPGLIFHVAYYHSMFPNPFYAKVAFDLVQLTNGFDDAVQFSRHYAFFGIGLLIPIVLWRRLSNDVRSIWLLTVGYSAYVVLIGGDTLKIHRFFLPLLAPLAVLTVISLRILLHKMRPAIRNAVMLSLTLLFCTIGYVLPWKEVQASCENERALTYNMKQLYASMARCDSTRFSVAASTIGAFGFSAIDHVIIDMLGLADSTVAHHPENAVPGLASTWRERKFNAEYVLSRAPDYIVFSTGMKPSAPAEKALLQYPQFLESYRPMFYSSHLYPDTVAAVLDVSFKHVRPVVGRPEATYPVGFVEQLFEGEVRVSAGDYGGAIDAFNSAIIACGDRKPYVDLLYRKAICQVALGQGGAAYRLLNQILEYDSLAVGAHRDLYLTELHFGNVWKAEIHRRFIQALTPCELPALDSMALAAQRAH
ncbi:MAG: hypothetical protein AB1644_06140 [Candidatus Zixiibacteriota bacterium]